MRRVNVRRGLAQRINDIIGTDQGTLGETDFPGITDWSIQAAMLENIRRVIKGIVGSAVGRPASGLWVTPGGGSMVTIAKGVGFTSNGNAVVVNVPFNYSIIGSTGDVYLYLKHEMAEYTEEAHDGDGGKRTEFIGKDNSNTEEIVYDDKGAAMGNSISGSGSSLIVESAGTKLSQDQALDYVYLCKIEMPSITIYNTHERCFESEDFVDASERHFTVPGIVVDKDAFVNRDLYVERYLNLNDPSSNIIAEGSAGIDETLTLSEISSITVKKGIIIGFTPV